MKPKPITDPAEVIKMQIENKRVVRAALRRDIRQHKFDWTEEQYKDQKDLCNEMKQELKKLCMQYNKLKTPAIKAEDVDSDANTDNEADSTWRDCDSPTPK